MRVESSRTVTSTDPEDPTSPVAIEQVTTVAGTTETLAYDPTTRIFQRTTAEGRLSSAELDTLGRPVRSSAGAGLVDLITTYDNAGRVATQTLGSNHVTSTYDTLGRLAEIVDAAGRTRSFSYDNADRIASETTPSGRTYQLAYDTRGRIRQVTMPNGQVHGMQYNTGGELTNYTPPGSPGLAHTYDSDRRRTGTNQMNIRQQTTTYDSGFRAVSLTYPEATSSFSYVGNTQLIAGTNWNVTGSGVDYETQMEYDGELLTATVLAGERTSYVIDNALRLESMQLNALPAFSFQYDADNLLTGIGPFSITRDGPAGRADSVSDGVLVLDYEFDNQGRLISRDYRVNGTLVYAMSLSHDVGTGQISQRIETVNGALTHATSSMPWTVN